MMVGNNNDTTLLPLRTVVKSRLVPCGGTFVFRLWSMILRTLCNWPVPIDMAVAFYAGPAPPSTTSSRADSSKLLLLQARRKSRYRCYISENLPTCYNTARWQRTEHSCHVAHACQIFFSFLSKTFRQA